VPNMFQADYSPQEFLMIPWSTHPQYQLSVTNQ
jgi:hypothetical protein